MGRMVLGLFGVRRCVLFVPGLMPFSQLVQFASHLLYIQRNRLIPLLSFHFPRHATRANHRRAMEESITQRLDVDFAANKAGDRPLQQGRRVES